ncbi:DUF1906 domain-containing protein [Streptomyces sp. NPDC002055]|uniref:DUF1906 domain-containing protein n=1 Tax=Streptomyces sp. NPDC002055 TaxID=3154534 RepID=UPI0033307A49
MGRRTKIIQYAAALLMALAAILGGLFGGPAAAAKDGAAGPAASKDGADEGDPLAPEVEVFTGRGFDTCEAPSLGAMSAWRKSQYRAVGVYIGGRGRACKQQVNLGPRWVRSVHDEGWSILPLYVGSQSPCVHSGSKQNVIIDAEPWYQGAEEGRDAVLSAVALGMRENSPIYLDMEAYDQNDPECADTTLSFVQGWNNEVRRQGFLPGFYSSSTSGVRHMDTLRASGVQDLPEIMWFARWDIPGSVEDEPSLADDAWTPHRRIHQYAGNVTEEYGGVTMKIDRNMVDAPVAVIE